MANSINLFLMIALVYALLGKEDKHISPFYSMAKNSRKNFFFLTFVYTVLLSFFYNGMFLVHPLQKSLLHICIDL